jgi:hypothetical protein
VTETGSPGVWVDLCRYYANLDPNLFQVPKQEGLVEWIEEDLAKPRTEDVAHLVAEVEGRIVGWVYARIESPQRGCSLATAP